MNRTCRASATSRMRAAGIGALMGTVLLSAGCGGSHSTAVSVAASTILTSDANTVAASATRSAVELSGAVAKMRSDVLALETTGDLSSARAAAVLAQMQRVVADAALVPTASPSTPAFAASPSPAASDLAPNTSAPSSGHGRKGGGPPPGHSKPHG